MSLLKLTILPKLFYGESVSQSASAIYGGRYRHGLHISSDTMGRHGAFISIRLKRKWKRTWRLLEKKENNLVIRPATTAAVSLISLGRTDIPPYPYNFLETAFQKILPHLFTLDNFNFKGLSTFIHSLAPS